MFDGFWAGFAWGLQRLTSGAVMIGCFFLLARFLRERWRKVFAYPVAFLVGCIAEAPVRWLGSWLLHMWHVPNGHEAGDLFGRLAAALVAVAVVVICVLAAPDKMEWRDQSEDPGS